MDLARIDSTTTGYSPDPAEDCIRESYDLTFSLGSEPRSLIKDVWFSELERYISSDAWSDLCLPSSFLASAFCEFWILFSLRCLTKQPKEESSLSSALLDGCFLESLLIPNDYSLSVSSLSHWKTFGSKVMVISGFKEISIKLNTMILGSLEIWIVTLAFVSNLVMTVFWMKASA